MKDFIIETLEGKIKEINFDVDANLLWRQPQVAMVLKEVVTQLEAAIQWVKDSPEDENNILSDDLANLNDGKLTQYPKK
jgi:hypothetical protein